MKKIKTLNIYYIVLILISLISLFSFKQKGNDFFIALSSITADLSIIIALIIVVYAMFICCNSFNKRKHIKKELISSILILTISISVIFISFINIFSHRNIIDYLYRVISNKENLDIILLFIKSLFIYLLLYLISINCIVIFNNHNSKINIIITIILILLSLLLLKYELLYVIIAIDIILFTRLLQLKN